jgi:hypothetical protein
MTVDARELLLTTAFRNVINEPNIEAGFQRFSALTDNGVDFAAFSDALAACLRDGLIREPVRLPEGALQCHWHLELTPKGVAAARAALDRCWSSCAIMDDLAPLRGLRDRRCGRTRAVSQRFADLPVRHDEQPDARKDNRAAIAPRDTAADAQSAGSVSARNGAASGASARRACTPRTMPVNRPPQRCPVAPT